MRWSKAWYHGLGYLAITSFTNDTLLYSLPLICVGRLLTELLLRVKVSGVVSVVGVVGLLGLLLGGC